MSGVGIEARTWKPRSRAGGVGAAGVSGGRCRWGRSCGGKRPAGRRWAVGFDGVSRGETEMPVLHFQGSTTFLSCHGLLWLPQAPLCPPSGCHRDTDCHGPSGSPGQPCSLSPEARTGPDTHQRGSRGCEASLSSACPLTRAMTKRPRGLGGGAGQTWAPHSCPWVHRPLGSFQSAFLHGGNGLFPPRGKKCIGPEENLFPRQRSEFVFEMGALHENAGRTCPDLLCARPRGPRDQRF